MTYHKNNFKHIFIIYVMEKIYEDNFDQNGPSYVLVSYYIVFWFFVSASLLAMIPFYLDTLPRTFSPRVNNKIRPNPTADTITKT